MAHSLKLGELLLKNQLVSEADLQKALSLQEHSGGLLGAILVRIGAISEEQLLPVLSQQLDLPVLSQDKLPFSGLDALEWLQENVDYKLDWWIDNKAFAWLDEEQLQRIKNLQSEDSPPDIDNRSVNILLKDFSNTLVIDLVQEAFRGYHLNWFLAPTHLVESFFSQLEKLVEHNADALASKNLRELAEEAPVIEFVNNLLAQAVDYGASDIHIEPQENIFEVRFRIDGVLVSKYVQPREKYDAIGSRIKLIANIDIAETRLPQDGRIKTKAAGKEFDIRVSTVPGSFGESIVLRLLPTEKENIGFNQLGFTPLQEAQFKSWVSHPHGIVLVTGPTGSGKSTTLYTGLDHINDGRKKIVTVEDPVEYQMDGITQVQALPDIGLTFASALRSFLRQDPDVMMVGEIRDLETAEIAIQSSLTGHLVVSTLHTNDAVSAFTRLVDMGVDRFLVATPIRAVMAQRLVRKLCAHCSTVDHDVLDVYKEIVDKLQPGEAENWRKQGDGCSHCNGSGYKGRHGIFEMVEVTPEVQKAIINGSDNQALWKIAKSQGAHSLREDGLLKARMGITSIDEVLRVTGEH